MFCNKGKLQKTLKENFCEELLVNRYQGNKKTFLCLQFCRKYYKFFFANNFMKKINVPK